MGKVTKIIENGISFGNAAILAGMLGQCVNVPLAHMDSFLKYLELQDKLNDLKADYGKQQLAVLRAYGITEAPYNFSDHPDRPKIEEALTALQNKEIEVKGIKDILISPIELAQITVGLTNNDRNFIKSFLVKK